MAFSKKQNEILKPVENAPHLDRFVRCHIGPRSADVREYNKWHHSDFDYFAYPFTHKLFDNIVNTGGLK